MRVGLTDFREVWAVDFEFSAPPGERPRPLCMVAWELRSSRKLRIWEDELWGIERAPYPTDSESLIVAYYASAELGCHLTLGWPMPENVLDLYAEFRILSNGLPTPCGNGLLGALAWFGLDGIDAADKDSMRQLALRGGPYTDQERAALLDYCESDVAALARLLQRWHPRSI
jgi:DNA polymerase I